MDKERIRKLDSLAILAARKEAHLILGAYGCGIFRNAPVEIAGWWQELLVDEGYGRLFQEIVFAVLDRSGKNIL